MSAVTDLISSGVPGLDAVLGGGLRGGHLYFVEGAPGTGKTTLGLQFALAGVRRGEVCLFVALAETIPEIEQLAGSHGWDLDGLVVRDLAESGQMARASLLFDLSEVALEERVQALLEEIESLKPQRLVLDALLGGGLQRGTSTALIGPAGCGKSTLACTLGLAATARGERAVYYLFDELVETFRSRAASQALDLSYLADAVIAQRYFEAKGHLRYAISVLKKRYGDHERTIREYQIGTGGIRLGEPLADFRGVLSGTPEYVGEARPLLRRDLHDA